MTYLELVIIDRFLKDIESSPLELRYGVVNAYKAFLEACILRESLKIPNTGQLVSDYLYPSSGGSAYEEDVKRQKMRDYMTSSGFDSDNGIPMTKGSTTP